MSTEKKIRSYILQNFLFTDDDEALKNEDSFLEKGVLDSTGILEVIYFIEDEFGIKVEDQEMIPENLGSVNHIVKYVTAKTT